MRTYRGSCHCGRFEVDAELDQVRSCVCSIRRRRGALIHRVEAERLVDLDAIPVRRVHGSRLP